MDRAATEKDTDGCSDGDIRARAVGFHSRVSARVDTRVRVRMLILLVVVFASGGVASGVAVIVTAVVVVTANVGASIGGSPISLGVGGLRHSCCVHRVQYTLNLRQLTRARVVDSCQYDVMALGSDRAPIDPQNGTFPDNGCQDHGEVCHRYNDITVHLLWDGVLELVLDVTEHLVSDLKCVFATAYAVRKVVYEVIEREVVARAARSGSEVRTRENDI